MSENGLNHDYSLDHKSTCFFLAEAYRVEFNMYMEVFNNPNIDNDQIGMHFCAYLGPKRKAMYLDFLTRQDDQNPKQWKNALRFIRYMGEFFENQSK